MKAFLKRYWIALLVMALLFSGSFMPLNTGFYGTWLLMVWTGLGIALCVFLDFATGNGNK